MCSTGEEEALAADASDQGAPVAVQSERRRLKIWQMRANVQCSVVGTCLAEGDLERIMRRCGLQRKALMRNYDVHGYFANAICNDCPVARAVQKVLDRRHEGIVRRVGKIASDEVLSELWDSESAAGRIPGAYWAFLTWSHVPRELHARVFGEVHMLSHLLGRTAQSAASRTSELEAKAADLEARLSRMRIRHRESIAERDRTIADLQARLRDQSSGFQPDARGLPAGRRDDRREQRLAEKRERALCVARQRARAAEGHVERLQGLLSLANPIGTGLHMAPGRRGPTDQTGCHKADAETIRVLYVGGRTGGVHRLREIASGARAELLHHDGGMEEAVRNLDTLLESCHAVFCPIDCVSHSACLRAKQLCRKYGKAFVPLRSSGDTSFRRALASLRTKAV
jgi:hypothetical protein